MNKRLCALLGIVALALTGCAGDDDGQGSDDTPTSAVPDSGDGEGGGRPDDGGKDPEVGPQLDQDGEDTERGDDNSY